MATRIKFCGITRMEDAQRALELGAWAIGMVLWPRSPRACEPARAAAIARAHRRRLHVAGVFVNEPLARLVAIAEQVGLTIVQLHGSEGPAYCAEVARRTGCQVIKAARVRSAGDVRALEAYHCDFHLLDGHVPGRPGGTGETFAWELARAHRGPVPLILSGGLGPGNVAEAIAAVHPFAVDVASGVESAPGIKDHEALAAFAAAVARAQEAPTRQAQSAAQAQPSREAQPAGSRR
jgi:phosphoribosylanthranilate isomerase